MNVRVSMHICVQVCMSAEKHECLSVLIMHKSSCMFVFMHVCMNDCRDTSMSLYVYMHTYTYECMHTYIFHASRYICRYIDMYCICIYECILLGVYVARHTWVCVCMHV